jgi:hypothetical protein
MKPLRQGDLDGLCGVYASLNAVQYLVPAARDWGYLNKLMIHIVGAIYTAKDVTGGGGELKMASVFSYAAGKVSHDFKISMSMTNKGRADNFESPVEVMSTTFKLGFPGLFVLGYEGRDSHWTVVRGINNDKVILFDSCGQKSFDRADVVWRKTVKVPAKSNKIVVSPTDINWISCGAIRG